MEMHFRTTLFGYILCSFVFVNYCIPSALGYSGNGSGANESDIVLISPNQWISKSGHFIRFDISILNELSHQSRNRNVVISPASIKSLLALLAETYAGNKIEEIRKQSEGDLSATSFLLMSEIQTLLKNPDSKITIQSQNKIYEALDASTSGSVKHSENIEAVDFSDPSVVDKINKLVNDATQGLIPSVIKPGQISENTKRFLLNCIYLKANWLVPFERSRTKESCFYNFEGECHNEKFMSAKERHLNYTVLEEYQAIMFEIPFLDPRYTITFILPDKEVSVYQVLKKLVLHGNLLSLLSQMKNESCDLWLPILSLEYTATGLINTLKQDKIANFFGPNTKLDALLKEQVLSSVDSVLHEAKIELNEEGAEAAVVSGGLVFRSNIVKEVQIKVDRPFIFFLRDKVTGMILFEGVRVI